MSGPELFLVCGGSGGIGGATCDALAAAGYVPVVGYCRGVEAAQGVASRCGGQALALDLASDACIDQALDWLASQDAGLAGVVLAGAPPLAPVPFGRITAEDMETQWRIHVLGPHRLLAGLVRRCWRARRDGVVVGVLSQAMGDADGRAASGLGAYVVAKYGLAGLLATLAADHPWLRVRSVRPGYTETRMLEAFDPRFLALQREKQPFNSPREVAALIVAEATRP